MAINDWWVGDNTERFWMEITNRPDVGNELFAPKFNDAGKTEWSYELLRFVRPGDLVLHWRKDHGPALTGYSHCTGFAFDSTLEWRSRGTYGRQHPSVGEEDGWRTPLQGYRELPQPLTLHRLRKDEDDFRTVHADLSASYGGKSLYFPFAFSNARPIRAAQAYLVKFPASLIGTIPELRELQQVAVDEPNDATDAATSSNGAGGKSSKFGRQPDIKRRKAVETYAVEQVMGHYAAAGYLVADVGAREPWDITASRDQDVLHIEVKGSTVERLAIDVTEGEVRHAECHPTILVVLDQIQMDASLRCSGGRWRYWAGWSPNRSTLVPTAYRHPLDETGEMGKPYLAR